MLESFSHEAKSGLLLKLLNCRVEASLAWNESKPFSLHKLTTFVAITTDQLFGKTPRYDNSNMFDEQENGTSITFINQQSLVIKASLYAQ